MRLLTVILLLALNAVAQWQLQDSHSKESLRGVSIADANTVWASGTHGTYIVTKDAGQTWTPHQVPGAEQLDFRGVKAFGEETFLLAAGPGDQSRIYHTADFGAHWELQFTNPEPKGFFDCMAFFDEKRGIVVGDPVDGKFQILRTIDGGRNWRFADLKNMPAAVDGEGAFAASNSCITVNGNQNVWFVTGGTAARVFHSMDGGNSWTVGASAIVHGAASQGIFSVAFRDASHGVIAGGDYKRPEQGGNNLASTDDGGKTWKPAALTQTGFVSAISYVDGTSVVAVGYRVTALLSDHSDNWRRVTDIRLNVIESRDGVTYAAGPNGAVGKLLIPTRLR